MEAENGKGGGVKQSTGHTHTTHTTKTKTTQNSKTPKQGGGVNGKDPRVTAQRKAAQQLFKE